MRTLNELLDPDDAISLIRRAVAGSPLSPRLLETSSESGERALVTLQVSTRSTLGAMAFHTGGILVDGNWLRVLGAGSPGLPRALDTWNAHENGPRFDKGVLVADDVLGGFFAWWREPNTVHYLAPDTAQWEDLELGYSDWLHWCLSDRLRSFYESLRWPGWEAEVQGLASDSGFFIYPPLWLSGPALPERRRGVVPVEELWALAVGAANELDGLPAGTHVVIDPSG